ncbi:acyltransferase [Roseateles flavus]|uniref:Acyltransferase n=1 Tax=Roseateles flavus TaxID=3149041 RepID=A0ABV0GF23_9BURK
MNLMQRLERWRGLISRLPALELEGAVRALLVHFFFHTSDKQRVELVGEGPRTVNVLTPTVFKGAGAFRLSNRAVFGVPRSPGSLSCSYFESRTPESLIDIGPGTVFNNRCVLISEGAFIRFGADCLVGQELQVFDSHLHDLRLAHRRSPDPTPRGVEIGNQVFIGARVTLLKGVKIGDGCIIAAGAVVTPGFEAPPMTLVGGNPARVLGPVPQD